MRIGVGDEAPNFILNDQDGTPVELASFRGRRAVVIYFYPRDDTPVCTMESCGFRDSYEDFTDAGAEVIGISADGQSSHHAFATKYGLPFKLLTDGDNAVRRHYGVKSHFGVWPGRVTFVIDREGRVRHVFTSQLNANKHVREALETLKKL